MKEWKCVEVGHHRRVAEAIEGHQRDGWLLHSYAAAGNPGAISHYLLFEREG